MTPISEHHPFRARPRISRTRFHHEMRRVGSPWADKALEIYKQVEKAGHDPAIWLAIGLREHRLLTDPNAVAIKLETNSWTNARSVRTPGMPHQLVTTEDLRRAGITDREGPYIRYRSVEDSIEDGMKRADDRNYVYAQRHALTIGQVLRIWTESDAEAYIAFVVARLREWAVDGFGHSWLDDQAFEYIPDWSGEYGYPKGSRQETEKSALIMHITAGTDSLGWLNGPNGSSAHYLTWPDGSPRAQLLPERWAAWTAGNREYNERGINLEHEKRRLSDAWTDEEYRSLAAIAARIIQRNPAIKPDREHVIGHNEVPDPIHPGRFGGVGNHADPGPGFEWPRFMAYLHEALDSRVEVSDPNAMHFQATDKWIVNDTTVDGHRVNMLDFWRSRGGVEVCGYPLEGMRRHDRLDPPIYGQLCENVLLECWPEGFGDRPGPHYRFGGLGQRYLELKDRVDS